MKLTRKQKASIDKLKGLSREEISRKLGLETGLVGQYLKANIQEKDSVNANGRYDKSDRETSFVETVLKFAKENKGKILLITLLTLLVYSSALPNSFVSDDKPLMMSPNLVNPLPTLQKEPVAAIINSYTYTLNYLVNGKDPFGYHLVNVIIHLLVSLTAFFFLTFLTNPRVALIASLIFSVNTIHTEPVDWVSGRHYLLYSLFALLSLSYYLYLANMKRKTKYYLIPIVLFIFAVYSFPEQAIVLPLMLPLIDFVKGRLKMGLKLYPIFFVLSIIFALLSLNRVQERMVQIAGDALSTNGGGFEFLTTDIIAIYNYIKLFLAPFGLTFYHEALPSFGPNLILYAGVSLGFLFLLPIYFYKKNKIVLFSVGFFVAALLPTLTPLKVSWVVAERYVYLSSLGLCLLLALFFNFLFKKPGIYKLTIMSFAILIIFWSSLTFLRGFDWKDEDSLWLATVKTSPNSSKAWNNMGDYYGRHGDMQNSFNAFVRATQINPSYSDAWHNAGNALVQMGKDDESVTYFEKSLQFNPNLIEAYNNLALVYQKKGDGAKAYEMINKSLKINPNASKTYAILAYIEYENKNVEKAKEALRRGLELDPQNMALQKNLTLLENTAQTAPQN